MTPIINETLFKSFREIKKSNPEKINDIKFFENLGFTKEQYRILRTNYDRLDHLYFKKHFKKRK